MTMDARITEARTARRKAGRRAARRADCQRRTRAGDGGRRGGGYAASDLDRVFGAGVGVVREALGAEFGDGTLDIR